MADKSETGRALSDETNQGAVKPLSTTQEAEKALETLEGFTRFGRGLVQDFLEGQEHYDGDMQWADDALAALRSLRTQHTEMQERIEELERHIANQAGAYSVLRDQLTQMRGEKP